MASTDVEQFFLSFTSLKVVLSKLRLQSVTLTKRSPPTCGSTARSCFSADIQRRWSISKATKCNNDAKCAQPLQSASHSHPVDIFAVSSMGYGVQKGDALD